ncbi:MAG: flagellar export chaperone FliS [Chitinophagales bacterium]
MSSNPQAYSQYKTSMVETSSPGKLLLMLYDAAVKNLENAQRAMQEKDLMRAHQGLVKTQDIIAELKCTLNMDFEISRNLFSLYEYIYNQLVQANVRKSPELVEEALSFIIELRSVWQEAFKATSLGPKAEMKAVGDGAKPIPVAVGSLDLKG